MSVREVRLRDPCGVNDESLLAATAQDFVKLVKDFPAPQQIRKAQSERCSHFVQRATSSAPKTLFFRSMGGKRKFAADAKLVCPDKLLQPS